jgi:hypothetical protein
VWVISALMFENLMYYSYVSRVEFFELEDTCISCRSVVEVGADWWVLVEASLRYACSPGNRKSLRVGLTHTTLLNTFDCPPSGGKPINLAHAWTYDL